MRGAYHSSSVRSLTRLVPLKEKNQLTFEPCFFLRNGVWGLCALRSIQAGLLLSVSVSKFFFVPRSLPNFLFIRFTGARGRGGWVELVGRRGHPSSSQSGNRLGREEGAMGVRQRDSFGRWGEEGFAVSSERVWVGGVGSPFSLRRNAFQRIPRLPALSLSSAFFFVGLFFSKRGVMKPAETHIMYTTGLLYHRMGGWGG